MAKPKSNKKSHQHNHPSNPKKIQKPNKNLQPNSPSMTKEIRNMMANMKKNKSQSIFQIVPEGADEPQDKFAALGYEDEEDNI